MRDKILVEALMRAGGVRALAIKLKISPQAVSKWRRIPFSRVKKIEKLTGISKSRLRPDIF